MTNMNRNGTILKQTVPKMKNSKTSLDLNKLKKGISEQERSKKGSSEIDNLKHDNQTNHFEKEDQKRTILKRRSLNKDNSGINKSGKGQL